MRCVVLCCIVLCCVVLCCITINTKFNAYLGLPGNCRTLPPVIVSCRRAKVLSAIDPTTLEIASGSYFKDHRAENRVASLEARLVNDRALQSSLSFANLSTLEIIIGSSQSKDLVDEHKDILNGRGGEGRGMGIVYPRASGYNLTPRGFSHVDRLLQAMAKFEHHLVPTYDRRSRLSGSLQKVRKCPMYQAYTDRNFKPLTSGGFRNLTHMSGSSRCSLPTSSSDFTQLIRSTRLRWTFQGSS